MIEKKMKKYGVILAFDVVVTREARDLAEEMGVKVFTADIIYHLFDQFKNYMEEVRRAEKSAARYENDCYLVFTKVWIHVYLEIL